MKGDHMTKKVKQTKAPAQAARLSLGTFTGTDVATVRAEVFSVVSGALNAISGAVNARETASGNVAAINRVVSLAVIRACEGGYIGDKGRDPAEGTLMHTMQRHKAFKSLKATVSQARSLFETLRAGVGVTVPETKKGGKDWTVAGVSYAEGATVQAAVMLAALLDPAEGDTSPLVIAKAASKARAVARTEQAEQADRTLTALAAFLRSPAGQELADDGLDAEGLAEAYADKPDQLAAMVAAGEAELAKAQARKAAREAAKDTDALLARVVGLIHDGFTVEQVDALEAAISARRAAMVEPAEAVNAHAIANAA
jgi:hypothetical protein